MVQWLRIHLLMHRTHVQSLVGERRSLDWTTEPPTHWCTIAKTHHMKKRKKKKEIYQRVNTQ